MPILRDIPITLDATEVLHGQGMGGCSSQRPEIASLTDELLSSTGELYLLEPAIAYEAYSIIEVSQDRVTLNDGSVLNGSLLPAKFPSARKLSAIVCTVGPKLEQAVSDYFVQGEPLRSLLLDGIGNAALDVVARKAYQLVRSEASSRGYQVSNLLSPGIPGFSISEQRTIFKLAFGERIGAHLTASGVMFPRKSLSMVMGMGTDMPERAQDNTCDSCNMGKTCGYRWLAQGAAARANIAGAGFKPALVTATPCHYETVSPVKQS